MPDGRPLLVVPPRPRLRIAVGAVVVLVLVGLGGAVVATMLTPRAGVVTASGVPAVSIDGGAPAADRVVIHVLGAVMAPGVYELRASSRVLDAIAAAGGFTADADRGSINLARLLTDAEQLRVPVIGELPPDGAGPSGVTASGLVDLNRADAATLETLPRVGPAMAARIIAWREAHGGFKSVQDLLDVSGVGQKTFDELAPLVTV